MSNNTSDLTTTTFKQSQLASTIDQKKLDKWCDTVRDIYILGTPPLSGADDPRIKYIIERFLHPDSDPQLFIKKWLEENDGFVEREYFRAAVVLPEPPLERPHWATSAQMSVVDYPEVNITYKSQKIESGDVFAYWEQGVVVTVDLDVWPDGLTVEPAGVVDAGEPVFTVCYGGSYLDIEPADPTEIQNLGETILEAVQLLSNRTPVLKRQTEPGEPDLAGKGGGL